MIAALTGKILTKLNDRIILDVHGVGYEVFVSTDNIARIPDTGDEIFLNIHTQVREDAITLFGFLEADEKELFLILKSVSGIGPKLAISMLSGLKVADLCQAIINGDIKRLTALQGIGKKTAERLCVELKEKVGHLGSGSSDYQVDGLGPSDVTGGVVADALSALTNLGYPETTGRSSIAKVKKRLGDEEFGQLRVEDLIREALRSLA